MSLSTTALQDDEIVIPAPTSELEFQTTPWATVECLEQLVHLAFKDGLGRMGTTENDQWVFHFTRAELAQGLQKVPTGVTKNPLQYDQTFHALEDLWVFVTFDDEECY
jgi:hypothetical protein